jgi:hypothetical protein
MGYPSVAAFGAVHATNSDATAKTVEVPAHAAGDRLVLVCGWDGAPTVSPAAVDGQSWVQVLSAANGTACRLSVHEIINSSANAAAQNITVTLGASERGAARVYAIGGSHSSTASPALTATATSANPNPPSLDPSGWAAEDTLWIAVMAHDAGNLAVTAGPVNYTDFAEHRIGTATTGAGFAFASRQLNAASEDPGVFTMTAEDSVAATVAIRGDPAFTGVATAIEVNEAAITLNHASGIFHAAETDLAAGGVLALLPVATVVENQEARPVVGVDESPVLRIGLGFF